MDILLQALVNGLLAGSVIAVPAVGFTAIFAILRYPSFAIAGYVTVGAFAGWWVNTRFGLGAPLALVVAFLAGAAAGLVVEQGVLRRLMPSGALTVSVRPVGAYFGTSVGRSGRVRGTTTVMSRLYGLAPGPAM